jgi:hypothetical protein
VPSCPSFFSFAAETAATTRTHCSWIRANQSTKKSELDWGAKRPALVKRGALCVCASLERFDLYDLPLLFGCRLKAVRIALLVQKKLPLKLNQFGLDGDPNVNVIYGPVDGSQPRFQGAAPAAQHSGIGAQATGNISGWSPANPQLSGFTAIVFPEGLPDPYIEHWFFGIQRELPSRAIIELNYIGTAGRNLYRAEDVNRVPGERLPEGTCATDNFGRQLCSQIDTNKGPGGLEINPLGALNPNYGVCEPGKTRPVQFITRCSSP